jgi:hypothetical protein
MNKSTVLIAVALLMAVSGCLEETEVIDTAPDTGFQLQYGFTANEGLEYTITATTTEDGETTAIQTFKKLYIPRFISNPALVEVLLLEAFETPVGTNAVFNEGQQNMCGLIPKSEKNKTIQFSVDGTIHDQDIEARDLYLPPYKVDFGDSWKLNSINYTLDSNTSFDLNGIMQPGVRILIASDRMVGEALFDKENNRLQELHQTITKEEGKTEKIDIMLTAVKTDLKENELDHSCVNQFTQIN